MNALGGIPETIDPTIETAGKTVAGTFVDLLTCPEVLSGARTEFRRRVAEDPAPALLPADFMPPTDLAWPDYTAGSDGSRVWYPGDAGAAVR